MRKLYDTLAGLLCAVCSLCFFGMAIRSFIIDDAVLLMIWFTTFIVGIIASVMMVITLKHPEIYD